MYSNQKDQINLEQVYINIHNDEVVEEGISGPAPIDSMDQLINGVGAVGVAGAALILLPPMLKYLKAKYGNTLNIDNLKYKLETFLNNPEIQKDAEHHGLDYVKSFVVGHVKNIFGQQNSNNDAAGDINKIFPDKNDQSLLDKAKNTFEYLTKTMLLNKGKRQEQQRIQQRVGISDLVNRGENRNTPRM